MLAKLSQIFLLALAATKVAAQTFYENAPSSTCGVSLAYVRKRMLYNEASEIYIRITYNNADRGHVDIFWR